MKLTISNNTPAQIEKIMILDRQLADWCDDKIVLTTEQREKIKTQRDGLLMALADEIQLQIKKMERV